MNVVVNSVGGKQRQGRWSGRGRSRAAGLAMLAAAVVGAWGGSAHAAATLAYDTWFGGTSTWSNSGAWSFGVPNNNATYVYYAYLYQGTSTLDMDATVNGLSLNNQVIFTGAHALAIDNAFDWNGGYVGYVNNLPTVTLGGNATLTMQQLPAAQGSPARTLWGTINSYGVTNYTGGGTFYINGGAAFNNYGQFNLSAAGGIQYSNGAGDFVNEAGAVLSKTGTAASQITANVTNAGSLLLNEGTLTLQQVTNQSGGVITAAAGTTLNLNATSPSNYLAGSDLNGAGAVAFTYGTHNFAAGTFHPTGPVSIAGTSTVNVKNTFTPASMGTIAGTLNTDADQSFNDVTLTGHIGGAGTVTFGGTFTWNTGYLDKASSTTSGHAAFAAGAQVSITPGTGSVTAYRIIDNAGTITQNGGAFYLNNGGTLNNNGVFYANGTGTLGTNFSPAAVYNNGGFDLITPGTYTVAVPFNNNATGVVNVDAGTMVFSGQGSNAGTISVLSGATVQFSSAMTHLAGSKITGAGNLDFSYGINDLTNTAVSTTGALSVESGAQATFGNTFTPSGTVNVAGTLVLNKTAASTQSQVYSNLSVTGTLGGSRDVEVSNHMDWGSTGSSSITGAGDLYIDGGAQLVISGGPKTLQRPIDNRGRTDVSATNLYINSGGSFNNYSAFNLYGASSIGNTNGQGAFNNYGWLNKTSAGVSTVSVPMNNNVGGNVDIFDDVMVLSGGGTNSGTITVEPGATLRFAGTMSHAAESVITGAGNLEFTSGINDLTNTAVSTTGTLSVGSNASATFGNVVSPSGVATVGGTLVSNKTAASSGEQVLDQLVLSGTLGGSRDVRVTGHLTWTGSSVVNGTGRLVLDTGVVTDLDGTSKTISRPVDNYGTINQTAGSFNLNTGASLNNYGTFNALASTGLNSNNGFGTFTNSGTFEKSAAGAYPVQVPFVNAAGGVVNVDAGTMTLNGGGANSGSFNLAAGTVLTFGAGYTYNAGSLIGGAGGVTFASGTHVLPAGAFNPTGPVTFGNGATVTINNTFTPSAVGTVQGNVTFNADESFADVTMAGNVGGTGNLTFSGAFNWPSGAMTGTGTTTLPAGSTWAMSTNNSRNIGRSIDSSAAATLSAGTVYIQNGATLTSRGSFDVSTAGFSSQSGGGTFANVGTFTKTGTSTFSIPSGVTLMNSGTVNVNQGILQIQGGGANSGTINVGSNGTLRFDANNVTHAAGSSLTGTGGVEFNGGTHTFAAGTYSATGPLTVAYPAVVTFNGPISPSSIAPIGGTLNVNADQTFSNLTLASNGTLGGAGDFLVTGQFNFNGGTLAGTGNTTFQVGSDLEMTTNVSRNVYRKVVTGGTVNYTAGSVTMYGTTWQLSSGLSVTGSTPLSWSASGSTTNRVDNTGGISVNMSPTATFTLGSGVTLNNIGSVGVQSGKLSLGSAPTQWVTGGTLSSGTWQVGSAGNLDFPFSASVTTLGNNAVVKLDGAGSKFDRLNALATNNGVLTLSNGRAFTTAGALSNTGHISVESGAALTAAGALTNTGVIEVMTGGTVTTNGALSSSGSLVIDAESTMTVAKGMTLTDGYLMAMGTLVHAGGTSTISATTEQQWYDGSALNVTGGTLTLASDPGGVFPNFTLNARASGTGTLRTTTTERVKSLTVSDGGTASLVAGSGAVLWANSLSLSGTGKVDLGDGRLIVDDDLANGSPTLELYRQALAAGNLMSSTANADAQHRMGIGYAGAATLGVTSWGGLQVYPGTALAKVTWLGDANLDGKLDGDDFTLIDRGMRKGLTGWVNGDFNYDGVVDVNDYLVIDRVFGQQGGGVLSPTFLAQRESQFGEAYVQALVAAVPEPGMLGAAGVAAGLGMLGRRRRAR